MYPLHRSIRFVLIIIVLMLFLSASPHQRARAATYTVTNTNDSGAGSLRQAILDANSNAGADVIDFNIPACLGGVCVIQVTSAPLPPITETITFDGTTQPGAACPAAPKIEIRAVDGVTDSAFGIELTETADNSLIRGLSITGFDVSPAAGIALTGADDSRIECNFVGLLNNGSAVNPNYRGIALINGATNNIIGTNSDGVNDSAERNTLSGNLDAGVYIDDGFGSTTGNRIQGNYIGLMGSGAGYRGNVYGVYVATASGNTIGSNYDSLNDAVEGNIIAGNTGNGVVIAAAASTGNRIHRNSIYGNGGMGIDLADNGVTANDSITPPYDSDSGANGLQNYPTTIYGYDMGRTLNFSLRTTPSSTMRIEVFASGACDGTGNGEGQFFVTSQMFAIPGGGEISGSFSGLVVPLGMPVITMTATNTVTGDTSEFSSCADFTPQTFTVTNTNDSGAGSLRQAITDANVQPGKDTIAFNIAGCPGGICTITPPTELPNLIRPVIIDGTTQPGASCPNNLRIVIQGNATNDQALRFLSLASTSEVRGLVIGGFTDSSFAPGARGIFLDSADNMKIQCNFIGTNAAGTAANGNRYGIMLFSGASGNIIGTDGDGVNDANERNLISGQVITGIFLNNAGNNRNRIAGNYIGTNAAGTAAIPNMHGIHIDLGTENLVGTNGDGLSDVLERNLISGNSDTGVIVNTANQTQLRGNYIGVNVTGLAALSNARGISVQSSSTNVLVGTNADGVSDALEGNLISGNTIRGIFINASPFTIVAGNIIGMNALVTAAIPNAEGIFISATSSARIGSNGDNVRDAVEGNIIAGNSADGIAMSGLLANRISRNSIYNNGTLATHMGIDLLGIDGVNANDLGDPDSGPNNLQNYPVITGITTLSLDQVTISATLNSLASTSFRIEYFSSAACDTSGNGEGQTFRNSIVVSTDATGNVSFNIQVPINHDEPYYTLTAIQASGGASVVGNTSEFSACATYIGDTFTVVNTNDSGAGSLREAITNANANTNHSRILFNIPGATDPGCTGVGGVCTITLATALPAVSQQTILDAASQAGASCPDTPRIVLTNGAAITNGLRLTSSSLGSFIRGFVIGGFTNGIRLENTGSIHIACNFIGTDATGNTALPNSVGIDLNFSMIGTIIGVDGDGMNDHLERNVISGNTTAGIVIPSSIANFVRGNYIGVGVNGTSDVGNLVGISITSGPGHQIGTNGDGISDALERNVISGNDDNAIRLANTGSIVAGNYIGLTASGTLGSFTQVNNILITGTSNIIGTNGDGNGDAVEGNILANYATGNPGIYISTGGNTNRIAGNWIGTDASGTADGGTTLGIWITDGADNNLIGTNSDGVSDALERNVIVGHEASFGVGVRISGTGVSGNIVQGNWIGVNPAGTGVIPNYWGVFIGDGATNTLVGTNGDNIRDDVERNVISGNAGYGVQFQDSATTNNRLAGNYIGTRPDGTFGAGFGNTFMGVAVVVSSNGNVIGANGDASAGEANEGNRIAFNGQDGVFLGSTTSDSNRISQNSIFSNGTTAADLGIDLALNGVTANDTGDPDNGPNEGQNFPLINPTFGSDFMGGTLNSTPSMTFRIEGYANAACDMSGNGEGEVYLGALTTTTDGSGNANWLGIPTSNTQGYRYFTAIAIDATGNTSEFSPCVGYPLIVDSTDPSTIFLDQGHLLAEGATIGDRFLLRLPVPLTGAETVTVFVSSSNPARLQFVVQTYPVFTTASTRSYVFTSANWNIPRAVNLHAPDNTGDPAGAEMFYVPVAIIASSSPNYSTGAGYPSQQVFVYDPGAVIAPSGMPTLNLPTIYQQGTYTLALTAPPGMILNNVLPNYPETIRLEVGGISGTGVIQINPLLNSYTRSNWATPQGFTVRREAAGTMTITHLVYSDITGPATSRYGGPIPVTIGNAVVNTPADVSLTHAVSTRTVAVGETFTYSLNLSNGGRGDVVGLKVTSRLPEGVAFLSAVSAAGGVCTYNETTHSVTCDYGGRSFLRGRIDTVTITVSATAPAGMTLHAVASSTALPHDPNPSNNTGIASPAVRVSGATGDIYAANQNGSGRMRLTNDPTEDLHPAWSPDGARIAFVALRHGNPEIYVMNADGSNQRRVTMHGGADLHPAWSPDGTRIVFASTRGGGGLSLYVMNTDGSNVVALGGGADAQQPAFSPDGKRIVYVAGVNGVLDVFVMNANGTGLTQLTKGYAAQHPTWSPDGAGIAFSGGASPELYVMTANGETITRLTNDTYRDESPTWAADGTLIFASDREGRPGLYRLSLALGGGRNVKILPISGTGANDKMPAAGRTKIAFAQVTGR
ncbi:MAG TPA: hypothetical protein PLD47_08425 [Aggregatilineales bacterium]|nr:PD40 domain-containing protein [Anaerolineales bacterium]HRE47736.1 hypothetical protein [Aggregatilineales bacterium]